ncbi:ABSCISIC ACID-INSENSITIVE 5-like protein 2 [Impatiens glandulifera]|uniref:ABSCISIC ACID-INSENSITIVE 5-like protein 2 n=1 Tax=Impatiens glandulifera TaxID=253017 RepID=UPI001FB06D95|nr:ABSCISIC ACID-INSENSITIVE 5-like protein 2 [Impatiens glandulifera]
MGTQRMGSQGVSGRQQEPKPEGLVRQGSLYSLTLDEVESQLGDLGKPLSSMNLDELLKTVWNVETNQADYASSLPQGQFRPGSASLNSQSSITLSRDLSRKTVDEVWQDIQQEQMKGSLDRLNQRQMTLGEMTLEDFLDKAGIVAGSSSDKRDSGPSLGIDSMMMPQQWMNYPVPSIRQQQQQNMLAAFMPTQHTTMVEGSYNSENQMNLSSSPLMGTLSDTQMPGRKRGASGDVVEKTVERRHKRMIKNRESAARSRARKQAYTNELENKVSQLEKENERLRRQKELDNVLPSVPLPEPKYQLRRTSSASF